MVSMGWFLWAAALVAASWASNTPIDGDKFKTPSLNDNTVENLMFKEKGININTFIVDFLMNRETILAPEEAYRIAHKITKQNLDGDFLTTLTKILDLAIELKEKVATCEFTKGKSVDTFVDPGLADGVRDQLIELNDFWTCSNEVPLQETGLVNQTNKLTSFMQWKQLQDLRDALTENPSGVGELCIKYLKDIGFVSEEMMPMVAMATEALVSNPDVISNALAFIDNLEMGLRSESGKRLINLFPEILSADPETAMEIFSREADYNQEAFFNLIGNNDMAQHFFKQVARFLIGGYELGKQALNDNMKLAIANGLLISNNFPALSKRNLLKSTVGIVEKLLTYVTVQRVEDLDMYGHCLEFKNEFEKLYFKMERFDDLHEDELVDVISQFIQDNVMGPVKDAWILNRFVHQGSADCTTKALCLYMEQSAQTNKINQLVSKGLAQGMLNYSWTSLGDKISPKDIEAAMQINQSETCAQRYGEDEIAKCDIFRRERQKLSMDLSFEHNEL